jgi:tetratricopeptide (TPR) repeat protein
MNPVWASERAALLDHLFSELQKAPDAAASEPIANAIKREWLHSGSDFADFLMQSASHAMEAGDFPQAVEILDRLIAFEPQWAEAWNQRATMFYVMHDYPRSMADIAETLKREPRHYGAIAGMGMIFLERHDFKNAYKAFEEVHRLYPQLETARKALDDLQPLMSGDAL